jgi:hypothetical protein
MRLKARRICIVRMSRGFFVGAIAAGAIATLAACSSNASQSQAALPSAGAGQFRSISDVARTGAAPPFEELLRARPQPSRDIRPAISPKAELYVSDGNLNAVEILKNDGWKNVGSIDNGTNGPDGDWYDMHGLYVANDAGADVTQYTPQYFAYTYSTGMVDPVDVTTDSPGNVYEADYDYPDGNGFVNEYAQESNTIVQSCSPGGAVEGVAVDKHGDVFVDYNVGTYPSVTGYIVEYRHGLAGCNGTVLGVTLDFAGGMAFDKQANLIVCDQLAPAVDVIAPPYNAVTSTLGSGYDDPLHVTINKKNTLVYVTDLYAATVDVLNYPSGSSVVTLNSSEGLSGPTGAVDGGNDVP